MTFIDNLARIFHLVPGTAIPFKQSHFCPGVQLPLSRTIICPNNDTGHHSLRCDLGIYGCNELYSGFVTVILIGDA